MTGTQDKIRGLFLATLMVMSVFAMTVAFSGSVAAANNAVSIDRVNAIDGSGVNGIDTTHNAATNSDDDLVEVRFNRTLSSISSPTDWYVEFEDGSTEAADTADLNGNGPSVTMVFTNGFDNGDAFNVTDIILNGSAAVTPDGTSQNTLDTDEGVDNIATSGSSEGGANKSVWNGETTAIITSGTGDEVFIQREDSTFVTNPSATTNNQIVIFETDGRDNGEYHVDFDGEEQRAGKGSGEEFAFKVRDLDVSITADDTSIEDEDDAEATVEMATGDRLVRVGVQDDDGDFESDKNMTETLDPSSQQDFNFGTLEDGTYSYYVEDLSTGISDTSDDVTVSETDENVEFNQSNYVEHRGDVVNITIDLEDADTATIGMGPYADFGYGFNATVENDDDDDQVTLQWNSWNVSASTADPAPELRVAGDDNLLSNNVTDSDIGAGRDDAASAGTYDIDVRLGETEADDADDAATVTLRERNTSAITIWTAPGGSPNVEDEVSDKGDIYDRVGINITQDTSIAEEDLLITQVQASGLEGAIKDQNTDTTDAFVALSGQKGNTAPDGLFRLWLKQTDTQLNQGPEQTTIDTADSNDAVTVVPDYDNDSYFAIWDLAETDALDLEDGDQFNANFTLFSYRQSADDYGLVGPDADGDFEDEELLSSWSFADAETEVDLQRDDLVRVRAQDNESISGTATMATGSEIDVRVQTVQGASNAFLLGPETLTVEDGTWSHDFDFSGRQAGTEFEVEVNDDVADDTEEDGIVMGEPIVQALSFDDQASGGDSVVVQEVQVSQGGFVAIHEGSASGDVVGVTRYLDPGEEASNVGVGLDSSVSDGDTLVAMPHLDTNGNERFDFPDADGPYTEDGAPVTDSAAISVGGEATPPPVEMPTPRVITPTPVETPTPRVITPTPGQDGPGFGVVVALIALIAAALLAVRRNN